VAGIPVFRGDRPLDRHLDIGIVKDDERRVAAELQRQLLDGAGALLHQISVEPVKVSLRTIASRSARADLRRRGRIRTKTIVGATVSL
jgi:hypothetical protein